MIVKVQRLGYDDLTECWFDRAPGRQDEVKVYTPWVLHHAGAVAAPLVLERVEIEPFGGVRIRPRGDDGLAMSDDAPASVSKPKTPPRPKA